MSIDIRTLPAPHTIGSPVPEKEPLHTEDAVHGGPALPQETFDASYYLRGRESGKSLYVNYRWLPDLSIPLARRIVAHLGAAPSDTFLDFGCLVQGSLIMTDRGVLPIEKLEQDDQVVTHTGRFSPITRRSYRPYSGEIVTITPRYSSGVDLSVTPDHPVHVVPVRKIYDSWKPEITGPPEWIAAKDLTVDGHWLAIPRPKRTEVLNVDPDFARLVGYYLAEGALQKKVHRRASGTDQVGFVVAFDFHVEEHEYRADVSSLMQKFFSTTPGWESTEQKSPNACKLSFSSKDGYHTFLSLVGKGAHHKQIPHHWITGLSDEAAEQLIVGAYRGDGTKSDSTFRFDYSTASVSLAVSIRQILLRLGIVTELLKKAPRQGGSIDGRIIQGGNSWHVRASGIHSQRLAKITGNTYQPVQRTFWYGRIDEDYAYIPLKSVAVSNYSGTVFNLDVEGDHSYSHPVCAVHNCARGYMVRALREIGYEADGIDCSEWATENADPAVRDFVKQALLPDRLYDWILAKDVLEHVPGVQLDITLDALARCARKGVFIVVPLSPAPYAPYAVADFEKDVTHVHRFTLMDWHRKIADACGPDFKVESTFRIRGMKDNYGYGEQSEGNGFVTCSRWNPWAVSEPLGGG